MAILIKSMHAGISVDYTTQTGGLLIGRAGGHDIRVIGDMPKGYTINQLLAACLPHITQLTGAPAASVTYSRPQPKPRRKKILKAQLEMFDE